MAEQETPRIVLFDGVCNVCNASVNFIIDRDRAGRFRFSSLQSDAGRALCAEYGVPEDVRTIVVIENGRAYTESTAVLRVARALGGAWPVLYAAMLVPRPLRDLAYRYFSANRYRWFGKREVCRVPTPELRARFLES